MFDLKSTDSAACGLLLVALISLPIAAANMMKGSDEIASVLIAVGSVVMLIGMLVYIVKENYSVSLILLAGLGMFMIGYAMGSYENLAIVIAFGLSVVWCVAATSSKKASVALCILTLAALVFGVTGAIQSELTLVVGLAALLNLVFNAYLIIRDVRADKPKVVENPMY